jgi:hypothetical protein
MLQRHRLDASLEGRHAGLKPSAYTINIFAFVRGFDWMVYVGAGL